MVEGVKWASWVFSPIGVWLVGLVLVGLGSPWFRRSTCWLVLVVCNGQLFLFSLPVTGNWLMAGLEREAAQLQQQVPLPETVQAIVVLGGATASPHEGVRDLPDLNAAADRLWVAARLYDEGVALRVLVSGGGFDGQPEADSMAMVLQALGVKREAIVKESQSRTTLENAVLTQQLLQAQAQEGSSASAEGVVTETPIDVALVTSAFHMPRAYALFQKVGLKAYPVVADIRVVPNELAGWQQLPHVKGLEASSIALREYLGRLQVQVMDWFESATQWA